MSCLVGLLTLTVWTACFRFPIVWHWTGIGEGDKPFLDLYGLLAAGERAEAGFDASQPNPLDPYNRPNVYTEWWLVTGTLGLTRADTPWLGVGLLVTGLFMALALLRPSTAREAAFTLGVLSSPAVLMLVSRANNDLVVFILGSIAVLLVRTGGLSLRVVAMALIAATIVLKYYPLPGILLLLHSRSRRETLIATAVSVLILLVAAPTLFRGLTNANPFNLHPEWLYAYGAPTLWRNFHIESALLWMLPATLLCGWMAVLTWFYRDTLPEAKMPTGERAAFLLGASFIAVCFFVGVSYAYKLVFALWLLPWLWRRDHPQPFPQFTRVTTWLLYAVLWFEGTGALVVNLLVIPTVPGVANAAVYLILTCQQLLTWMLIACLLRWIFADVLTQVRRLFQRVEPGFPLST